MQIENGTPFFFFSWWGRHFHKNNTKLSRTEWHTVFLLIEKNDTKLFRTEWRTFFYWQEKMTSFLQKQHNFSNRTTHLFSLTGKNDVIFAKTTQNFPEQNNALFLLTGKNDIVFAKTTQNCPEQNDTLFLTNREKWYHFHKNDTKLSRTEQPDFFFSLLVITCIYFFI